GRPAPRYAPMKVLCVTTFTHLPAKCGTWYGPARWLIVLSAITSPSVGYAPWSRVKCVSTAVSLPSDAEPRAMALIAVGRGRVEVLAPCLDPLPRPAEPARDDGDQHLLGVRVALDAEAAADVGGEHAYSRFAQPERARDGRAHRVRHLRRGPYRKEAVGGGGMGDDAARLDRHAGDARQFGRRLPAHRRIGGAPP